MQEGTPWRVECWRIVPLCSLCICLHLASGPSGSAASRASNRHGVTEGSTYVRMEQKERIQYVVRGVAKYREFPF